MKRCAWFATLLFLLLGAVTPAAAQDPPWFRLLGDDPVFQDSMRRMLTSQENAVSRLSFPDDPGQDPASPNPNGNWQSMADALAAFVNIYKLSGDAHYKDVAQRIADWFLAWNNFLLAHKAASVPYVGWGPASRTGYFNVACASQDPANYTVLDARTYTVDGYHADEAWDTAAALRGLIKYAEIDPARAASPYFLRAKQILDAWSTRDHASNDGNPGTPGLVNDGPYAAAGMRWYAKSNEPCEIRYVKNTNIVMGEQLFRAYRLTQDTKYLQAALKVLHTQLWDILTHRNFGYDSFMIYVNKSDPIYDVIAQDRDRTKVIHTNPGQPDNTILCKNPAADSSCWNHLGFEAYDLYQIQQLISDLVPGTFPVPDTQAAVADAIGKTMTVYRTSDFGATATFPWGGSESPTHVTAYNCAQRFSADPSFLSECVSALGNSPSGGTIFYSLVPDGIFTQGPAK